MASTIASGTETPISVKITYQGVTKKFKVPLTELSPALLPSKLRGLLSIPDDKQVTFERFSDSAGSYISLDPSNAPAYRTLFRAAKAKQKLRLRATSPNDATPSSLSLGPVPTNPAVRRDVVCGLRGRQSRLSLNPAINVSETTLSNTAGGVRVPASYSATTLVPQIIDNEGEAEAPVPKPLSARDQFFSELANITRAREIALRSKPSPLHVPGCHWSVYCNSCDQALPDDHWHCDTCDQGDYDLCNACHDDGKHCKSSNHFMVKRWIENGKVVTSHTERIPPKSKVAAPFPHEWKAAAPVSIKEFLTKAEPAETAPLAMAKMPGAYAEEKKPEVEALAAPTRTCNCCVKVYAETQFVTCLTCDDYDLCMDCHCNNKHGHHPGHAFKPAVEGTTVRPLADFLLAAGRNVRHAALCDGCDRHVYGVRHKCLNCPDWDFCSDCIKSAHKTHPGHRFVPVYEPLPDAVAHHTRHIGVYCDGPLCKDLPAGHEREPISGVRYKCAICHDTDFCANCEATPNNRHNRTHPLIKFKTPVRNVSVTTMGEDAAGQTMPQLGDMRRRCMPAASTVSQVQPIVDVRPAEEAAPKLVEKIEIKDLLAEPIIEKVKAQKLLSPIAPVEYQKKMAVNASTFELNAHFVHDTIIDGTKMQPNQQFVQTWTLKNPGPHAWPAGCSVRYVGGDNMLNISDHDVPAVTESVMSNALHHAVQVGEQASFRVIMRAPVREGTSISYWRLKTVDGVPFGHRLWCHISVSSIADVPLPSLSEETDSKARHTTSSETGMVNLFAEMAKRRQAMADALKQTEISVKQLEAKQNMAQPAPEEEERQKRVQMLRALHAARLAAVSAEKKEVAAGMRPMTRPKIEEVSEIPVIPQIPMAVQAATRAPPAPTVEDVPEKEEQGASTQTSDIKVASPDNKSTMIFPKLEKESPASSTHDVGSSSVHSAVTVTETVRTETATDAPLSPTREESELFEDAESVEILDDSESDDGFLTDEEYDILDASDEEFHS